MYKLKIVSVPRSACEANALLKQISSADKELREISARFSGLDRKGRSMNQNEYARVLICKVYIQHCLSALLSFTIMHTAELKHNGPNNELHLEYGTIGWQPAKGQLQIFQMGGSPSDTALHPPNLKNKFFVKPCDCDEEFVL